MGNVIGIISSSCCSYLLVGLTKDRPIAAVPFGGKYRLLDFALSNMVNAGLRTVGIITPYNYRPVLDHLGAGKEWLLDRKMGGLFILPGLNHALEARTNKFFLQDLRMNIDFLKKDRAEHVIISCCNYVANIAYKDMLKFHEKKENSITLIYREEDVNLQDEGGSLSLEIEADGRVKAFTQGIAWEGSKQRNRFLDMMIIKRELLLQILQDYDTDEDTELIEVIEENLAKLKVDSFQFKGYLGSIESIQSYFECSMDLLKAEVRRELFMGPNKILTKITDNPPSRYGSKAAVKNSLISSGCKIEGQVENSILFREVHIEPGAVIKNSIIMQKSYIGKDVILENVIADKFVRIKDQTVVKGKKNLPIVIEKTAAIGASGGVL